MGPIILTPNKTARNLGLAITADGIRDRSANLLHFSCSDSTHSTLESLLGDCVERVTVRD